MKLIGGEFDEPFMNFAYMSIWGRSIFPFSASDCDERQKDVDTFGH